MVVTKVRVTPLYSARYGWGGREGLVLVNNKTPHPPLFFDMSVILKGLERTRFRKSAF
jgi:hypothetical protein